MKKYILILAALISFNVFAETVDSRYCGEPERYSNGKIKRNANLVKQFKEMYPIPEELKHMNFEVDHVIPLANGGCDSLINLQYLPQEIKSTSNPLAKDRWERKLYKKD